MPAASRPRPFLLSRCLPAAPPRGGPRRPMLLVGFAVAALVVAALALLFAVVARPLTGI